MIPIRLLAVARKEIIQLRRDTRSLILAFLLPVVLLVLFGYAITWDVRNIATVVVDYDHSPQSRELVDAFRASGYFTLVGHRERTADVIPLLDAGEARLALILPPDFSARLGSGQPTHLQVLVDGSDANTAEISLSYARAIVLTYALQTARVPIDVFTTVRADSRVWYNEEISSRNMIVPGLVAVIMMIIAAMLTSLTIAREWERGTMEQLAATPVTRAEVVLGKLLPYLVIGLVDVGVVSLLGRFLFDVPFRGQPLLLMLMSLWFLVGALGLGMCISAVARSQLLATQMALIITFLPAFLLSGFMFTLDVMPTVLQALSYVVPARYFLVVTRGIFLKGVGVEVLWVQGLLMIMFAVVGLSLAMRVIRKELAV